MAITVVGPINDLAQGQPGGNQAAYNITAAGVIFGPSATNTITAITQANQAVVTISTGGTVNPFSAGQLIGFIGVTGMTQINNLAPMPILAVGGVSGAWTITTAINSTGYPAYVSGGICFVANSTVVCNLVCQVGGSIVLNDCPTVATAGISNQIISVTMTAGQVITLDWPCADGVVASSVTTGTFSLTFS